MVVEGGQGWMKILQQQQGGAWMDHTYLTSTDFERTLLICSALRAALEFLEPVASNLAHDRSKIS
eukprot:scaffold3095_cov106-Skeletonema_dohrnii-CCMP3373.AAC.3